MPISNYDIFSCLKIKLGLTLYDALAGHYRIVRHKTVRGCYLTKQASVINSGKILKTFSYWDAQTNDSQLVQRVASSASKLGAKLTESCEAKSIEQDANGWKVTVKTPNNKLHTISALYVVNALGPWSNLFLEKSQLPPTHQGIANKGVHLILPDLGLQAGLLLEAYTDKRLFFLLPWEGKTLVGTTESLFHRPPDSLSVSKQEVDYLLNNLNPYLKKPIASTDILSSFAGLRWLAAQPLQGLSSMTREHVLGEIFSNRGSLITIYGGKLTSYRNLAETIGNKIIRYKVVVSLEKKTLLFIFFPPYFLFSVSISNTIQCFNLIKTFINDTEFFP